MIVSARHAVEWQVVAAVMALGQGAAEAPLFPSISMISGVE